MTPFQIGCTIFCYIFEGQPFFSRSDGRKFHASGEGRINQAEKHHIFSWGIAATGLVSLFCLMMIYSVRAHDTFAAMPDVPAGFFGINAERPHEDVYNSDTLTTGDGSWSNHSIEASVTVRETSAADGTAGLVVRSGADGYYYFGIYPNEGRWKLFKSGDDRPISGKGNIGFAQTHHLRVVAEPGRITAFIDGAAVGLLSDASPASGKAGLFVKFSDTEFSNVKIDGAPQDLTRFNSEHAIAWTDVAGASVRGNVILDPVLLADPELSPRLDARFKEMAAMGAERVRFRLSWAEIQPRSHEQPYSWRYSDAFAIAAHDNNLEIIPNLINTPRWAVNPEARDRKYYYAYPPTDSHGDLDTGGFAQFTAAAVERYKNSGQLAMMMGWAADGSGQARYFEAGPEFNAGMFYEKNDGLWEGVNAGWLGTLAQYVDLLKAGRDAVKGSCPACLVLNGAVADDVIPNYYIGDEASRYDGYEPWLDYTRLVNPDGTYAWRQTVWQGVDDLYDEIGRRAPPANDPRSYFDVLNIHTFMWKGYTSEWPVTADRFVSCSYYSSKCWEQWYERRFQEVTRVMSGHGDHVDIWLTETGFPSARPPNDSIGFLGFLSEYRQGMALQAAYARAAGFAPIKGVFWWQAYDTPYTGNLGLVREDMSIKPSHIMYGMLTGSTPFTRFRYGFNWYDDAGGDNWLLMANPAGAGAAAWFESTVSGHESDGFYSGIVPAGQLAVGRMTDIMGGPLDVDYLAQERTLVSQRILWPAGGYSLEEIVGTDMSRISDHYYWTWYDMKSAGYSNWVIVSNPNGHDIYYEITIAGEDPGPGSKGVIPPGENARPAFPGIMGGPVEVRTWTDSSKTAAAGGMATQRVLSGYGKAFSEVPGIPAVELSSNYIWTWYDMEGKAAVNWVLIANPNQEEVYYEITIAGEDPGPGSKGTVPPGGNVTPVFPGLMGGPVEIATWKDPSRTQPAISIASQRVIWGQSFTETPGYAVSSLASTYNWTWYDMQTVGMQNWVLIANPGDAPVYYEVSIPGVDIVRTPGARGTIPGGGRATPAFPARMGGPVRVEAWADETKSSPAAIFASQRVLYNGFFNETPGTALP